MDWLGIHGFILGKAGFKSGKTNRLKIKLYEKRYWRVAHICREFHHATNHRMVKKVRISRLVLLFLRKSLSDRRIKTPVGTLIREIEPGASKGRWE